MRPTRPMSLIAAAACLALPAGAAALGGGTPIVIDDFSTTQATLTATAPGDPPTLGSVAAPGILGGERDATLVAQGVGVSELSFTGGRMVLSPSVAGGATIGLAVWDGVGAPGLGGADLTAGSTQNAVRVRLTPGSTFTSEVVVRLVTGGSESTRTILPAAAPGDVELVIPYSRFSGGADPANTDSIALSLTSPGLLPSQASVDEITTDAVVRGDLTAALAVDSDNDGLADPGDEIQVDVAVTNPADAGGFGAPDTALTIAAPPGTEIVTASVQGSAGVSASLPTPGTVLFDLGDIADGAQATVQLRLRVVPAGAPGPIALQGTITGDGLTGLPTNTAQVTGGTNAGPTAIDDAYTHTGFLAFTIPAATGVLANDNDPDGDPLSAALVAGPTRGQLSLAANGSFGYAPTPGLTGLDTFTYRASDGRGGESLATVRITVLPQQAPPATPAPPVTPTTPPAFTCTLPGRRTTLNLPPTISQLRINQRISIAAIRRLNSVRARLDGRPQPVAANKPPGQVRLTTQQLRINQRIAEAGFVRAKAIYDRLGGRRSPTLTPLARTIVLNRGGVGANQLTNIRALDMLNCINANLRRAPVG